MISRECRSCGKTLHFDNDVIEIFTYGPISRKCDFCNENVIFDIEHCTATELLEVKQRIINVRKCCGAIEKMKKRWFTDPDWFLAIDRLAPFVTNDGEFSALYNENVLFRRKNELFFIIDDVVEFYDDIGLTQITREDMQWVRKRYEKTREKQFGGFERFFLINYLAEKSGNEPPIDYKTIRKLVIPEGVETINGSALENTTVSRVILPTSLKEISYEAFALSSIVNLWIPESVVEIRAAAFSQCKNLISAKIYAKIKTLSRGLFADCVNLEDIYLPNPIEVIEAHAFMNCKKLHKIFIPDSVQSIEDGAFKGCKSLTEIFLPPGVLNIGRGVFSECSENLLIKCKGVAYDSFLNEGCKVEDY